MTTLRLHNFVEGIDISRALYAMVQRIEGTIVSVQKTLARWTSRRAQRKQLQAMSDHMLADIGLTRSQVAIDLNKFFWQR